MLKQFFNKTFWKYFIVSTLIFILTIALFTTNEQFDTILFHSIPSDLYLPAIFYTAVSMLPPLVTMGFAVAIFFTFRRTILTGVTNYFKLLATGLLFVIPFATANYLYQTSIQPHIFDEAINYTYSIKSYSRTPLNLKYNTREDLNYIKKNNHEEFTNKVVSNSRILFKIDSVTQEQSKLREHTSQLLATLPRDRARDAYDFYKLESWDIAFQHSDSTTLEGYPEDQLYQMAGDLEEISFQLIALNHEKSRRLFYFTLILIVYLIFATLGYTLRGQTISRICGYIAIVIVIIYSVNALYGWCSANTKEVSSLAKTIR